LNKVKILLTLFLIQIVLDATSQNHSIINNVSFSFDDNWREEADPEVLDSAVSVGYRYLGDSIYSFRVDALVRVNYVPRVVTIDQIQIEYFAETIGMYKLLSAKEGENWKSSILVANTDGAQHISLHRVGVINGVVLELMLFFENAVSSDDMKVITLDEKNVIGKMSGLYMDKKLGQRMIAIFHDVSRTLGIFTEKEESFSFTLIDPPKNADVYRKVDDN